MSSNLQLMSSGIGVNTPLDIFSTDAVCACKYIWARYPIEHLPRDSQNQSVDREQRQRVSYYLRRVDPETTSDVGTE